MSNQSQTAFLPHSPPIADRAGKGVLQPIATPSAGRKGRRVWLSFVGDTLAIAVVLGAINRYLFPSDPCWLRTNPTPLLLLPLLIGGRYGASAGVTAGALASGAIMGVMHLLGTGSVELLEANAMTLVSLPIIGLFCGEIHGYLTSKTRNLEARCDTLEAAYGRTATHLELCADSNIDLQNRLAGFGARLTALDSELRRLLDPSISDIYAESLLLLHRVTEISEAALYSIHGPQLHRVALLGAGGDLPENIWKGEFEIVEKAIAEKSVVTCRDLWGETPQMSSRHLAAFPWKNAKGDVIAVLLLRRLPFHRITWQHFAQIETICDWIAYFADVESAGVTAEGGDPFAGCIERCLGTYRKHALPSSAIYFVAKDGDGISQERLVAAVAPLLRSPNLASRLKGNGPANLAVLLPMVGIRDAERLIAAVSEALPSKPYSRLIQTEGRESRQGFLSRLTGEK